MRYKQPKQQFNVIVFNVNAHQMESYDVIPYFIDCYREYAKRKSNPKLTTFDEFKEFIKGKSMYMFWSRCEWEIIISDWPRDEYGEKIDVHYQIMMNIDVVTKIVMQELGK